MSVPAISQCSHSGCDHFLKSPLCKEQPLWKRIMIVIAHILTAGIPLAIYHLSRAISCCHSKTSAEDRRLKKEAIESAHLAQEAIHLSRQKLVERSGLLPTEFKTSATRTYQPINSEIAQLFSLHTQECQSLHELAEKEQQNLWVKPEAQEKAAECLKVGYTVSHLTLNDLPKLREQMCTEGHKRSKEAALAAPDSYSARAFFACASIYQKMRNACTWSASTIRDGHAVPVWNKPAVVPVGYAQKFYEKGSTEYDCRLLFNKFCDEVKKAVSVNAMNHIDKRFMPWVQKDVSMDTYSYPAIAQPE